MIPELGVTFLASEEAGYITGAVLNVKRRNVYVSSDSCNWSRVIPFTWEGNPRHALAEHSRHPTTQLS